LDIAREQFNGGIMVGGDIPAANADGDEDGEPLELAKII